MENSLRYNKAKYKKSKEKKRNNQKYEAKIRDMVLLKLHNIDNLTNKYDGPYKISKLDFNNNRIEITDNSIKVGIPSKY